MDSGSKYKTEITQKFLRIDDKYSNRLKLRLVVSFAK